MWRPDFEFTDRRTALATGWKRRFWQGSTDHRGTPAAPGRVVTLLRSPGEHCWGVAYRIAGRSAGTVLGRLDFRERGGYQRHRVPLYFARGGAVNGLLYVATPENANYLGPAALDDIARQISVSRGPSGSNRDYLSLLAEALAELDIEDDHVSAEAV